MAVTVGEVQAVLTARDEMSAALQKASAAIDDMQQKMGQTSEKADALSGSFDGLVTKLAAGAAGFLSIQAVIGEVKEGLDFASSLEETSRATGIATDELQKLDYVGNQFGLTGDMLARTIETLSARLAKGDKNAADAVAFLGLNIDDLLASGPEQAFETIASAANKLTDPMEKNGVLSELLGGRLGRLVGSMGDVKAAMDQVGNKPIISTEAIDSAHQAETALKNFGQGLLGVTAMGVTWWTDLIGITGTTKQSAQEVAQAAEIDKLYAQTTDAKTQKLKEFLAQRKQEEADAKAAAEQQKQYNAAWADLATVGEDWQSTLDAIDEETKASVQYYLDAGASIEKIAKAFELSASQARAFQAEAKQAKQDEKDWEAAQKDLTAAYVSAAAAQDALFKQQTSSHETALKQQEADEEASLTKRYQKGQLTEQQYETDLYATRSQLEGRLEALQRDSLDRQLADLQDHENKAKQAWEDRYNNGVVDDETYQEALSTIDQEYADKREAINEKADADQAAARKKIWQDYYGWLSQKEDDSMNQAINDAAKAEAAMGSLSAGGSVQYDLTSTTGVENYRKANGANTVVWSDQQIIDYIKSGHTLAQVIAAGGIVPYGNMPGAMGFADGGVGDFGAGTPAVLHGKEAIVPLDKAFGSGGAFGGNITNHFYVNGTAEETARKIGDLIMQTVKRGRLFGSAS